MPRRSPAKMAMELLALQELKSDSALIAAEKALQDKAKADEAQRNAERDLDTAFIRAAEFMASPLPIAAYREAAARDIALRQQAAQDSRTAAQAAEKLRTERQQSVIERKAEVEASTTLARRVARQESRKTEETQLREMELLCTWGAS